jgi:predicted RNase H-like HicB family nuclease
LVFIRRTATGYSVDVPDLPGCVAVAKTVKSARRLIAEAIGYHLELMRESGEVIPPPRQSIEFTVDETSEEEFCTWVEVKTAEPVPS